MEWLYCILIGYFIGCINPAYFIGKIKGVDVKKKGSKNAGASNALMLFGKVFGAFCALFDIFKAWFAIFITKEILFITYQYAFVLTAVSAIFGHIFPFYMRFRGGKGFAPYIGMTLAVNWKFALVIMAITVLITIITDYIAIGTFTTVISFPVYSALMMRHYLTAVVVAWKREEREEA